MRQKNLSTSGTTRKTVSTVVISTVALLLFIVGGVAARPAFAATGLGTLQMHRLNTPVCITKNLFGAASLIETICDSTNRKQQWGFIRAASGQVGFNVVPLSLGGECMEVQGGSTANGAAIVLSRCDVFALRQQWLVTSTPLFGFLIENANSHKCLTRVPNAAWFAQQECSPSLQAQNFLLPSV
jgi:hypothetical protein